MKIETLTREAFAPFGEVIETSDKPLNINQGFADRFDDLCKMEVGEGEPKVSIFEARPRPTPIHINIIERHPLGSQAFYPLQNEDWLVVVCLDPKDATSFRCFRASGHQGVNYARGTWHFPLLVFAPSRFIVVDRKGPGVNLEEAAFSPPLHIIV